MLDSKRDAIVNAPLLIVLPTCADDGPLAEKLLDWIYELNGKQQRGHILLAYAHDLHQEFKIKLKICAELAFESVSEFTATSRSLAHETMKPIELKTKVEFTNNLFNQTAHHIAGHYRWPWLWVEPDCVPITPDWIEKLAKSYQNQPKKFMGRKVKRGAAGAEQVFFTRIGVYPTSAYNELRGFVGSPPLEWTAGNYIVPRGTSTKLIQPGIYGGDIASIAPETVLYHSDKTGKLIEQLREKLDSTVEAPEHKNGESVEVHVGGLGKTLYQVDEIKDRLLPTGDIPDPPNVDAPLPENNDMFDPEPTGDKRKRAWREWKARQKAFT